MVWDLDSIFKGGSQSNELNSYVKEAEKGLDQLEKCLVDLKQSQTQVLIDDFEELLNFLRQSVVSVHEIASFVSCLTAQDVKDKQAKLLLTKRAQLGARLDKLTNSFSFALAKIPAKEWQALTSHPSIQSVSFVLNEYRAHAQDKLSEEQEGLITDLGIDGYQAWEEMYDTIVGKMTIEWEGASLSVGQVNNKLDHSDRSVRELAFSKLEQAWQEEAELMTETLNHLAGFRLHVYQHRGWDDVLKEPLTYNRMSKQTLTTMWDTITKNKPAFYQYLERKAQLLHVEKLAWYDLEAPVFKDTKEISYQEAAEQIVSHFGKFSERMASFATKAFEASWIEAEDRPGKRPGGFCTSFLDSKQTRIFMTYAGTASSVSTLAHELGHAYHQYVMDDLDPLNQDYAMNVAETASTLAELVVADAAVENAKSNQEKIALVEEKVQRSLAFFMNIHARFLFETRFYEARKHGYVSTEKLNQLMEEAQKEAYGDQLGQYHPLFWASKLHFHITDVPFYNFPYTFGYLFSLGIYAFAKKDPKSFSNFYDGLLQDTGRMTVEQLAHKHLNVDLQSAEFWQSAIDLCKEDVALFLQLTE